MSDRRTFLENAAAAVVMAKMSSLRSFRFATDGPEKIDPTMSDREKAGLRSPVKQYTEEIITPGVQGDPEMRSSQTTEYDPDGRFLSTSIIDPDGSKRVTNQQTYDADGRLTKTISGNGSEPRTETLYAYDEAGKLLSITESNKDGGSKTDFHFDEQGRKTGIQSFDPKTLQRAQRSIPAVPLGTLLLGQALVSPPVATLLQSTTRTTGQPKFKFATLKGALSADLSGPTTRMAESSKRNSITQA